MLDAELVEDRHDGLAQILPVAVRRRDRLDQEVDRLLGLAAVERREGVARLRRGVVVLLEADPRLQPVGGEAAVDLVEDLARGVRVAPPKELRRPGGGGPGAPPPRPPPPAPGGGDGGLGAPRLELQRAAQRVVVAGRDERVGLGGHELVEEALDDHRRLRADELVDDRAVLERFDGRDALDAVLRGNLLVGIRVELREDDLALACRGGLLEDRGELAARAAPGGPEVDDDRGRPRALDDLLLEVAFADVDDGHGLPRIELGPCRSTSRTREAARGCRSSSCTASRRPTATSSWAR